MLDTDKLKRRLNELQLDQWADVLSAIIDARLSPAGHGDFETWQNVLAALPQATSKPAELRQHLLRLAPWRKGPFDIGSVHIDSEWRSDRKWARVAPAIAPLKGRNVLDVGCGNGYYSLQMKKSGAHTVLGIDPTILYVMQFLAVTSMQPESDVFVVPARLEELPLPAKRFDTTFSMGVLYHQRSPLDHLRDLRTTLRAGGQLVLETLYLPGEQSCACTPADRYARMRNVWLLPTLAELRTWLVRTGYSDINVIDTNITTVDEQRSTEWMTFESLREALDPTDTTRTIEGWPAPHRVVVTAISP